MSSPQQRLIATLKAEGITNPRVLNAIARVPREHFLPDTLKPSAYENEALPIGYEQTISQPFVVARMSELILTDNCNKVLEIGTGSGYQAAILSQLFNEVYTIERIKPLLDQAKSCFQELGYDNIHTRFADGSKGWPQAAPFDAIIVTAAAPIVPKTLPEQLGEGGKMIIPVGNQQTTQWLQCINRNGNQLQTKILDPVVFVPLLPGTTG